MANLNFLCDERIQALSAQAESFLNRLREVFTRYPMALDEHGRAPADSAQLRNLTYPHRPDIRHTYVARWFAEIESAFLVTVYGTAPRQRFELRCDALEALAPTLPVNKSESARVIHISQPSGPGPPAEIIAVAASASSVLDFIARTRERGFYHGFDLEKEWNDYVDHRRKKERPSTLQNFVETWMQRAQRRFGKIKKLAPPITRIDSNPPIIQDEPDLFDLANHKLFMARYQQSKS